MTIDTRIRTNPNNGREYATIKITVRGESISHRAEVQREKGVYVPKGYETTAMKKLFGPVYQDVLKALRKHS